MSWTKERMALLKKMWLQGKSAAEIAKKLGQGMTRNAVIGKAHRMGLSGGRPATAPVKATAPAAKGKITAVTATKAKAPVAKAEPVAAKTAAAPAAKGKAAPGAKFAPPPASGKKGPPEKIEPAPLPATPKRPLSKKEAGGITLLEVSDRVCRWPIGDPRDADFYFCGRNVRQGMPYCHDHASQAYQSISRKPANEDVAEDPPVVEEEEEITTT